MNEETFVRELERRADDVHGAPFSFDDVRGKARSIRRRRRAVAVGAVAAAVAVVAVVPATLSGHLGRADGPGPAQPAPTTGTTTVTTTHTAVLHDGTVTLPDGSTVDIGLENADVTELGLLDDGRIVAATQRPQAIQVFTADGDLQRRYDAAANTITMSPDDHVVAWPGTNYDVQVLEGGVEDPVSLPGFPLPGESYSHPDGVTGSDCAEAGCRVYGGDGNTTSAVSDGSGEYASPISTSAPLRIDDVSPDGSLWAVTLPDAGGDPQFGCSGLYDPDTRAVVARNCDTSLLRFAPDGEHLLGARGDNGSFGYVGIFDIDLRQVGSFDPEPQVVSDFRWADDSHLLVTTAGLDGEQWSLVRVGLDGEGAETVAGPVDGDPPEMMSPEFRLSE